MPVRTAGDWLLGIDLEPPPGWSTELHAVTPDQELLQLASETGSCRVVASLPSTPAEERTEPPIQAERVWVRGRSVQYFGGGLRWVYGDGGDVTLTCTDQDRAGLLGMADRIRFTAGRPFTLPFALEQLPTGMRLVGAGYQDDMPVIALSRERMDTFVLITVTEREQTGRPTTLDGVVVPPAHRCVLPPVVPVGAVDGGLRRGPDQRHHGAPVGRPVSPAGAGPGRPIHLVRRPGGAAE